MKDSIVALASGHGKAGVGVIRLSGKQAHEIATQITGKNLAPRLASLCKFRNDEDAVIDQGIALFFPGPHSFTGEDVVEFQGHGGPVILDMLMQRCVQLGARLARAGEFSERAFLNNKIDLAQAEAIADLIDAQSQQSAKLAIRSLEGEFSKQINELLEKLIYLRMYVEAAIDFPEEEIDFLSDGKVSDLAQSLRTQFESVMRACKQGSVLREGIRIAIAGKPNAGKSSLLNALSGKDSAIVTDIPGTTRDVLREHLVLDGLPVHLLDTAGLRDTNDTVEKIGIARANNAIADADLVLLVVDATESSECDAQRLWPVSGEMPAIEKIILVRNKCDQNGEASGVKNKVATLSAKSGVGISELIELIKQYAGIVDQEEALFLARRRHIDALQRARVSVENGIRELQQRNAGELLAENLRLAQQDLNEITGEFSSDDLLGRIFSSFCIGK